MTAENAIATGCLAGFIPARGLVFIQHIETSETYAQSPIVVTPKTREKIAAQQFVVVSVGDYERCEDPECNRPHTSRGEHRHRLTVGDWVLCRNRAWSATPDPDLFVIRQRDVLGVFREGAHEL